MKFKKGGVYSYGRALYLAVGESGCQSVYYLDNIRTGEFRDAQEFDNKNLIYLGQLKNLLKECK
jgi:hypothetical protein